MVVCNSSWLAMSILLTTTTLAHSTCSASNWPTFSRRALFFSSCLSPRTTSFRSCACRVSSQSLPKLLASTTVTTCFTSVRSATGMVHSRPMAQFRRTASGSPTPLSSTTMCSKGRSFERITMFCTAVKRSSAEEQQTHPFCSSVTSTKPVSKRLTSWESMLTAATSLTTTPILTPSWFSRRCFSSEVFPVPRKPLRSVTGVFGLPSNNSGRFSSPKLKVSGICAAA
mmetsp:Transcript_95055/g.245568  ORF Transcript_95055/g.245568 Transcript_95055/m.245568 type:complete len:227 (-) Transcript_95055:3-683(-)